MEYRSDTEMVVQLASEILQDGQPHVTKEVIDIIFDRTDGKRIDGRKMTRNLIHSAIQTMVARPPYEYRRIDGGMLQKLDIKRGFNSELVLKRALKILNNTADAFDACFSVNLFMKASEDELASVLRVSQIINQSIMSCKNEVLAEIERTN